MVTSRETPGTSRHLPGLARGERHAIADYPSPVSPMVTRVHPDSPGETARTLPGHPAYSTGAGTRPNGQRYGSSGNSDESVRAVVLHGSPPSSSRREREGGEIGAEWAISHDDRVAGALASARAAQGRPPYLARRERESGENCTETAIIAL